MEPIRIEINGLHDRLINVRKQVKYLKKENQSHQYKYVSSEQVLSEVRDAMNNEGLLAYPAIRSHVLHVHESINDVGKKRTWFMFDATIDYTIVCPATGETLVIPWAGQGVDDAEKGIGKALTYAEKYLFLKLFLIPTGKDDPDAQQNQPTGGATGQEQKGWVAPKPPPMASKTPQNPPVEANPAPTPAPTPAPSKSGEALGAGWREFSPVDVRVEDRKGRSLFKLKGVTNVGSVDLISWDTKVGEILRTVAEARGKIKAHISVRTNGRFTDYHVDEVAGE